MSQAATMKKERVTAYLDPELNLKLRMDRARSKKNVSDIIEEIIRDHYSESEKKPRKSAKAD